MKVTLLTYTPDAEKAVAAAARLCYSATDACDLYDGMDDEKAEKLLQKLVKSGHYSPFEHASFTFAIDGISRACSHQFVRHRLASYSQKSQRYVKEKDFDYVVPVSIACNKDALQKFVDIVVKTRICYDELVEAGIPAEDARYLLPNACETNIVVTMNARELRHFFSLRCCSRAQWEIRAVAMQMLRLAQEAAPLLFEGTGASCVSQGVCYEGDMCCKKGLVEIRRR